MAIQKQMPQSMKEYFEDPLKRYRHFQKVMKFHYEQERQLVTHLCATNELQLKKVQDEIQGLHKLQQNLNERVARERERVRKLKEYIAYHERRLEQARYMTPPATSPQPRLRYPPRNKTGASNASVKSSATSPVNCMPQLTQSVRAHYAPRSPTLSNKTSSGSEVTLSQTSTKKKSRTPPPLLPCSEYQKKSKHTNNLFSMF